MPSKPKPKNAGDVDMKVDVGTVLTIRVRLDDKGLWIAEIRGHPGCFGDGATKMDAVANAVALYFQVQIMRINRGQWIPKIIKNED